MFALAFISPLVPSSAQVVTTGRYGSWETYAGRSSNGRALCGITIGRAQQSFHIKYFEGNQYITFQMFKQTWQIPNNTQVPLHVLINFIPRWNATARGYNNFIQWHAGPTEAVRFLKLFTDGLLLQIVFLSGNETPWTISLNGSPAATRAFLTCYEGLIRQRQPTQPFNATPTQPFNPAPPQVPAPRGDGQRRPT